MQLIMENWRQYSKQINEDRDFNLILEKIENSNDENVVNETIEQWLFEQERIMSEIDVTALAQKGRDLISQKVNDFLITFYFKATNVIQSILKAGLKAISPAIKVLKFINDKVGGFLRKHPVISKIAIILLLALVMLCASAVFSAAAANPKPEDIALTNKIINVLQGILADSMTDVSGISGAQDLLSPELTPEVKTAYANAINKLETLKGQDLNAKELIKLSGDSGDSVESALNLFRNVVKNPPTEDFTADDIQTAISKWERCGEAIEKAYYSFKKFATATGSSETERLGFSGPGFPTKK